MVLNKKAYLKFGIILIVILLGGFIYNLLGWPLHSYYEKKIIVEKLGIKYPKIQFLANSVKYNYFEEKYHGDFVANLEKPTAFTIDESSGVWIDDLMESVIHSEYPELEKINFYFSPIGFSSEDSLQTKNIMLNFISLKCTDEEAIDYTKKFFTVLIKNGFEIDNIMSFINVKGNSGIKYYFQMNKNELTKSNQELLKNIKEVGK